MPRLSQLVPRTHWTTVGRERDGQMRQVFVIWKMWLGRCYDVIEVNA